jgi:hypothetical protein
MIEDPDWRKRIVSSIHDTSHMGLNRTTDMVSGKYYWPRLTADVKAYVRKLIFCMNCKFTCFLNSWKNFNLGSQLITVSI